MLGDTRYAYIRWTGQLLAHYNLNSVAISYNLKKIYICVCVCTILWRVFVADLAMVDNFGATSWDYARNRQLHYCMLILASYIRQQAKNSVSGSGEEGDMPGEGGLGVSMDTLNVSQGLTLGVSMDTLNVSQGLTLGVSTDTLNVSQGLTLGVSTDTLNVSQGLTLGVSMDTLNVSPGLTLGVSTDTLSVSQGLTLGVSTDTLSVSSHSRVMRMILPCVKWLWTYFCHYSRGIRLLLLASSCLNLTCTKTVLCICLCLTGTVLYPVHIRLDTH